MRIIGGQFKGKKIQAPSTLRSRPTTDFAKESLFNILNNQIDFDGMTVLDLFAGTGNISYEFMSRGVEQVWAVDMDRKCVHFIHQFCERNQIDNIKTVKANTYQFLKTIQIKFDLVYADPPYNHAHVSKLAEKIFAADVLNQDGMVIIEHGPETDYSDSPYFKQHRKYGNVNFSFFSYE